MGNFFGQIIQFLTSPIGFIILFGLIGGLGKLGSWLSHERAKRAAALARARSDDENLRTGRPITVESTLRPVPGTQATATTQAERQRALQEQRAAQLRALQQKRLEELRAKRAGQQGARSGTPAPARQPAQAPSRPQTQTHTAESAQAKPAQHSTTRRPAPPQRMQPPVKPSQLRPQQPSQPQLQRRQPVPPPPGTRPVEATEIGTGGELAASPYQLRGAQVSGIGALLGAGQNLRQAIVLAEILGPPISERDPEKPGIF
ncbi:MAG: hypothetical protein LAT64_12895 [Phycisphaerales bacterium]|nr:hypothetical protein [Planctomycetota bacterium]MCH8509652.1 hypothetical protein [Phycisphaerales bacterium]